MLMKEMKYDAIATGRMVLPLTGAVLLINIVSQLVIHFFLNNLPETELIDGLRVLLIVFSTLSIFVLVIATQIIVIYRYYRSMGSDEAYLTFSLPIKNSYHIISRVVVSTFYCFISTLISVVYVLNFVPVISSQLQIGIDFYLQNSTIFHSYFSLVLVFLLLLILSIIGSNLQFFAAISFGVSSTSPVLTSVAAYMIINLGLQIIMALFSVPLFGKVITISEENIVNFEAPFLIYMFFISIVMIVIPYVITWYRTEKKLNIH